MSQNLKFESKVCLLILVVLFMMTQVQCGEVNEKEDNRNNGSLIAKKLTEKDHYSLEDLSKALTSMIFTGRKKGGGGGGGMSMFFMRTLMDMFNATVPMMAMTVLGWMKDIMLMGAGAFMMMMYDMLNKKGDEKKIIIKLAQAPPEPAPPAQTGYGPWEG
ncbi:uncharacterized protein LOC123670932 [Harmonia axyridis]|uniref:uncharacterized protein LOC123670932 n=1 Tax=Harmonia axyridis TaxID=115357 RepID=UPI001E27998E|nr:uncharacterized protein LOC123670932 [Harmonia axyridis]